MHEKGGHQTDFKKNISTMRNLGDKLADNPPQKQRSGYVCFYVRVSTYSTAATKKKKGSMAIACI